jgi:hypothetical protein
MIQDGVTFSVGLLTPGGDAALISVLGVPQLAILIFGITLLIAGIGGVVLLLPLAGIDCNDPPRMKLFIILIGMCSLMLIRAVHSFVVAPAFVMENLIPLVFALLLAAIIVLVHPTVIRISSMIGSTQMFIVTWSASYLAIVMGAAMFTFQLFNFD